MTMTEQFFHLKPEKPVQTIGATSILELQVQRQTGQFREMVRKMAGGDMDRLTNARPCCLNAG
jgi:hypothetical protein